MRILHINCNYIGTTLHQLMIEELDKNGIENDVFVATYDSDTAVITPNENVYVSECFNKWDRIAFDYKQRKIIRAIEEHYDMSKFDIIHAYTLFTDGNVARILSEKYDIPFVVAVRNTDVNDFFKKMIHLRTRGIKTMQRADKVFFLSESYRRTVFKKYVPKRLRQKLQKKTQIVPNGIDEFWFDNALGNGKMLENSIIHLIYAGGIDKNKNIIATQEAMKLLYKKGIVTELTVIGKVKDKAVEAIVKRDKYTKCFPAMKKQELIKYYKNNDIFVMPSIHESFGLVYVEAMTQGLPVIYTEDQGFDGQFPEGTVGYHVNAKSALSIAEAIEQIMSNYTCISENAIVCSRNYMWEIIVKNYISVYENILNTNIQNN